MKGGKEGNKGEAIASSNTNSLAAERLHELKGRRDRACPKARLPPPTRPKWPERKRARPPIGFLTSRICACVGEPYLILPHSPQDIRRSHPLRPPHIVNLLAGAPVPYTQVPNADGWIFPLNCVRFTLKPPWDSSNLVDFT
ncbi:hypothetical protein NL676_016871 [Syzygium grande]|nr:hypothetical protein NL676_016871 [Syzygium grande]